MKSGMSSFPTRLTPAQVQALQWMVRRRDTALPPVDERAYGRWLEASPDNLRAAEEVQHYWLALGQLSDDPEILAQIEECKALEPPRRRGAATAAASMLFGAVICVGWVLGDQLQARHIFDFAPMSAQATVQSSIITDASGHTTQTVRTAVGERSVQRLPDGSVVTLDSGSTMLAHYSAESRSVRLLRGRAFFEVAHETQRPFEVTAAGKTVVATGTAFAVDVEGDDMVVTLVEGSVRVETPRQMLRAPRVVELEPGYQMVASTGLRRDMRTEAIDVERAVSWTSGRLHFSNEPLGTAVAEVNRYTQRKVIIRDRSIAELPIVGTFPTGDIDAFIRAIRLQGLVSIRLDGDDRIELVAVE